MKKLILLLLLSSAAWAQSFYRLPTPFPNTTLNVCPVPSGGNPCPSPINIYQDQGLAQLITQPATVGVTGNFGFWVSATVSQFTIQIHAPYNVEFIAGGGGGGGSLSGMTAGQVPIAATASTVTSSKSIQGSDANLLSSGTVAGIGSTLCTDANAGATTTGCPGTGFALASYTFDVTAGVVHATNNRTGAVDFANADATIVVNNVLSAAASVGALLYFRNGIYPINSLVQETQTGCTNTFYGFGIPSNVVGQWVQFRFEGETRPPAANGFPTNLIQTTGVIFNITPTAVASVTGTNFIAGLYQRPASACGGGTFSVYSNEIFLQNIDVRFPANTRGNEGAIVLSAAASLTLRNVSADFNQSINTLAGGAAPAVGASGSWGIQTSFSTENGTQILVDVYAMGYDTCFDLTGEHLTATTIDAAYCNHAAQIGRLSGNIHPMYINHFIDQENLNGIAFGPGMNQGSIVNLTGYDIEMGAANWYARTTGACTESHKGFTGGIITYEIVLQGSGMVFPSLFTDGGGTNFQQFPNGGQMPNGAFSFSDNFTRANGATLGPLWWIGNGGGTIQFLQIVSNHAEPTTIGVSGSVEYVGGGNYGPNQFSRVTVGAISTSTSAFIQALARGSYTAQTYYTFFCNHSNGGLNFGKQVAGTFTSFTTNAQNCAAGDQLEIDAVGNQITAYYIPSGSTTPTITLTAIDSAITSGAPGVGVSTGTAGTVYITGYTAGNLPNFSKGGIFSSRLAAIDGSFGSSTFNAASPCETAFGATTLSIVGTTTDTGLTCLPANSVIDAVVYRITTTITTAASFTIGDATTAARFCATQSTLTAGTTGICMVPWTSATAGTMGQVSAASVRVTTNVNPGAGAIRLIVYYHTWTPPTS